MYAAYVQNVVRRAGGSALRLVDVVRRFFPSYDDVGTYKGRQVLILKRAQILVADIWAAFEGKSFGAFEDIDAITMFADYRVPQSLLYVGALQYDDTLMERLVAGEEMTPGEEAEVEIRGCSIWAVELLQRRVRELAAGDGASASSPPLLHCNAILCDFYLWDYAKSHKAEMAHLPIHRVRSVFY